MDKREQHQLARISLRVWSGSRMLHEISQQRVDRTTRRLLRQVNARIMLAASDLARLAKP